ncbi:hypothetical protein NEMIN01_1350 [Nematocida minor]|uniref:uncharacterized protein n=1 Tax=Nematocida minor TaxID=1912983 RepID=UPI00222119C4|nr:uncharacterized protein NEMIN01_1350 [Nematocida minor]KAI5191081.1 hypothetical protein NEMIN01_1350 [Nematocida minor]
MPSQVKTIQWTKTKIFFTVFAFIFSIAVIFLSFLPIITSSISLHNTFTILVGLIHGMRMIEFIFILTNGQWAVWLFTTYMLNVLAFYAFNYNDIESYIDSMHPVEQ